MFLESLDQRRCWVDAWAFQRLLGQADAAEKAHDVDSHIAFFERASHLYRNGFLPLDADQPWVVGLHQRLYGLYMRHLSAIGRRLQEIGRHEEALTYYARGLGADPLAEALYQGAMRNYLAMGRYAEGIAVYRRLQRVLSVTLGIRPSSASEALHHALLGQSLPR